MLTQLARHAARRGLGVRALTGLGALGLGTVTIGATAPSADASTPLRVVTTADVKFNLTVAVPGHYVTTLHGSGQIDFVHHNVTLSLDLPAAGLHPDERVKDGTAVLHTGPIQVKGEWIGGAAYVSIPASVATQIKGAPTASYPMPSALAGDLSTSITQTAVAITYAHLLLDTLVGQHTRSAGHQTMSGVKVSGTAVGLTLAELLKIVPAIGPVMGTTLAPMTNMTIPVTIWTDSDGRLVQATFSKPKSSATGLSGTVRFSNFNAPLTLTAPPSGTVHPMSKGELAFLQAQDPLGGGG